MSSPEFTVIEARYGLLSCLQVLSSMVFPSKFFLPGSPRIQGGRESGGGEENSGHAQGPLSEVGLGGSKTALAGGGSIESEIFSGSCAV